VHPLLRASAERQLGLFTAIDARRAGYDQREIQRLLASGTWVRLRRGVYTTADDLAAAEGPGRRHRLDCFAVLLDLGRPETVVSHSSAARLWDLPVHRRPEPTVRLTDPYLWRAGRNFRMNKAPLRSGEVWRSGPVRFTSAPRTLVDCAREWPLEDAVIAMDAALLAGRTILSDLIAAAELARSWPGGLAAVRAASLADGRSESPLETRGRLRILGAGLPTPELQVEIHSPGRLVGVVDAWFDDAAVAVEFDGRIKYTAPWRGRSPERVLWEEKRREDELRALDIRVVRVADDDLGSSWPQLEGRLRRLLATPGPVDRRFTAVRRMTGRRHTA
jgi:Transcriptional regulator, AbiEi antitoxin